MDPTARIAQAYGQQPVAEIGEGGRIRPESIWRMFNDAGVEIDVGEFLYGLVRLAKPRHILETGTHLGIAAAYMGLALLENEEGRLISIEFNADLAEAARGLMDDLGLSNKVEIITVNSLAYEPEFEIDMLLLDTEPPIRFDEFDRYYDYVVAGGFIAIHDLHPHAGRTFQAMKGIWHWPYGDLMEHRLGSVLASHELGAMPFDTPRGFMLFQKMDRRFVPYQIATGTLEDREFWNLDEEGDVRIVNVLEEKESQS
jgi:hypothetical protein